MIKGLLYWLSQRLRDFLLWPANLVRDFPIRSVRLAGTLTRAVNAVLFFIPELLDARRHNEVRSWLSTKVRRFADWTHQLIAQLFDLLGGPEIAEFLIHMTGKTTPLTSDEIKDISHILGLEGMRYGDVRVVEGGLLDLVFRFNGNLAFATWRSICLPQTGKQSRQNRGLVIHELTHIYQFERIGSRYMGEAIYMLIKTKRDCYNYGGPRGLAAAGAAGRRFHQYNREQQAMITQDFYIRSAKGLETTAYEPFIAQLRSGEL